MVGIDLPVLVEVSSVWLPEIDRTQSETFLACSHATAGSNYCPQNQYPSHS